MNIIPKDHTKELKEYARRIREIIDNHYEFNDPIYVRYYKVKK